MVFEATSVCLQARLVDEEQRDVDLPVDQICAHVPCCRSYVGGKHYFVMGTALGDVHIVPPNLLVAADSFRDVRTAERALSLAAARVAAVNPFTLRPTEAHDAVLRMAAPTVVSVEFAAPANARLVLTMLRGQVVELDRTGQYVLGGELRGRRVWMDPQGLHVLVRGEAARDVARVSAMLTSELISFVHAS
mgnify:CR=1 FL=1